MLFEQLTGAYIEKSYVRYHKLRKVVSWREIFCIGPFDVSGKQVREHFGV